MATHIFSGYGIGDYVAVSGAPAIGATFRISPDFNAATDAITFTLTDDDATLSGSSGGQIDASQQTGTITDAQGSVLYSGPLRVGWEATFTLPDGTTLHVWDVWEGTSGGTRIGLIADGEIPPGVTFQIGAYSDTTTAGTWPSYSSLHAPTADPSLNTTITGGTLADSLYGGAGDDSVTGGAGNDTIDLGDGNDTFGSFSTEAGADCIHGGLGNDCLIGGGDNDQIWGDEGNDTLSGGVGDDNLSGGAGNDVFGIVDDHAYDNIDGGTGSDTILFGNFTSAQGVVVTFTGSDSGTYDFVGTNGYGAFNTIEAISGTDHADTIDASLDTNGAWLIGNGGADRITGGSGNDTLDGGAGNDTLSGGAGADYVFVRWGDGVDSITGGETGYDSDFIAFDSSGGIVGVSVTFSGNEAGSYAFAGGASGSFTQIEWLQGTTQGDTINAAATTGGFTVNGGLGDDSLTGGSGADHLVGDLGNDTLSGGAGADMLSGGSGNDLVSGGSGDDLLTGMDGNDTLLGEEGNDYLNAMSGANRLEGGSGADTIFGGTDADTIVGGTGNDSLTTGTGLDVIVLGAGGGIDRVTDFDTLPNGALTTDQLDTSGLTGGSGPGGLVTARDVVVTDDGFGNALLTFPSGEQLVLAGIAPASVSSAPSLHAMGVPCFVAGARIATPGGLRPVETLAPGDLVNTLDAGPQPVLWVAARQLGAADLARRPEARPVELRAGAFGNPQPLCVSAQHGVLLAGALVRAGHLAQAAPHLARRMAGRRQVRYHHLLLPQHALIRAEGVWAESLWPGPMAYAALLPADRVRLLARLPALAAGLLGLAPVEGRYGPRIRPLARRRAVAALVADAALVPPGL